ncbi:MAG: hypothetical protein FWB74_04840 [Defluviitaleaceae bacterium]|nr:hypothetical protein [Defluviitaleaceae bacterium]
MTNDKEPKLGLFHRFIDWINRKKMFRRVKETERPSQFEDFLKLGRDEGKDDVVAVVGLCDEGLDIVADRIVLINRLENVEERMGDVAAYGGMTADDVEDLKSLLDRYSNTTKEGSQLRYQVTSFDAGLEAFDKLEDEAKKAVPEIKFAESRQRIFKQDIGYLEGERMVLSHERERLQNGMDFVYKFSIGTVVFFALAIVLLVFLYAVYHIDTILVLAGMLVFIVILAGLLYSLRQKLRYELQLNHKKQRRAVELLNTKIAVYAHFTNYLNYEYRKYKVRNAKMLENNLEDYGHYKHMTKRLDALRNISEQTEAAIEYFLKDKGISGSFGSIEKFASTLNIDDKIAFHQELFREKTLIENSLKKLDERSAQIWDSLAAIKAAAKESGTIIATIIDDYAKKAARLVETDKHMGTTAMLEPEGDEGEAS